MDRVDQGTVAALARRHDGVVTHPQLRKLGLSDRAIVRWVSTGRLNRLFPRVYSIGHDLIPTDGWRRAVVHTTGPRSALSHESAIALWKIAPQQRGWHVVVPAGPGPRRSPPTITVHRSRMLSPDDVRTVRGIPVTSVARTLADLASCVEPDRLAKIVHEAEVMRLLNVTAVIEVLDRCPQRRGAAALRALLSDPAPVDNREFVRRYLGFCKRYALPQPEVGAYLNARLPHLTEADMYYRRERLVVELDGAAVHLTRKRFESDRRRDSALLALDIPTVRVTWRRLTTDAASLAAELHEILARRRVGLTTQSVAQPSQ